MRNRLLRMIFWRLLRFLRRYFRALSLIVCLCFSVSVSAYWQTVQQQSSLCYYNNALAYCQTYENLGQPWRIVQSGLCYGDPGYRCQFWVGDAPVCPDGQSWNQDQQQCVDIPSQCPGNLEPDNEGVCYCGEGITHGYKSNPDMTLTPWCFGDPPPDFDPCTPDHPKYIGDVNGEHYCEIDHDCPADHQMGYVNGEQVCLAPINDPDPNDPDPNDPDPNDPDPNDPDPNDPDPNDPDNPNPGSFDDSRIVNGLNKIDQSIKDQTDALLDGLDGLTEDIADGTGDNIQSGVDGAMDDAISQAGSEIADAIGDGDSGLTLDSTLKDTILGLIPQPSCTDLMVSFKFGEFNITCEKTQLMRDLFGYIMYVWTAFTLFNIIKAPVQR